MIDYINAAEPAYNSFFILPIGPTYVRHWGLDEAIREILQNAIDSDSPFDFEWSQQADGKYALTINSCYSSLDASTLVLGSTSKADDNKSIGSFGEGYKIALVVLTREGYPTHVLNNGLLWSPEFIHDNRFNATVLRINEADLSNPNEGLSFVVGGLGSEDLARISKNCLHMQDRADDAIETSKGDILPSSPGELYVNGLFVCKIDLKHGYNIKPQFLKLERDRQTVGDFDLKWIVKDMWSEADEPKQVAEMVLAGVADVEYIQHSAGEAIIDAVHSAFESRYPDGVAASSPQHALELEETVVKAKPVYVNAATHGVLQLSSSYRSSVATVKILTPAEVMQEWYKDNEKYLCRLPKVAFKKMLKQAAAWRTF